MIRLVAVLGFIMALASPCLSQTEGDASVADPWVGAWCLLAWDQSEITGIQYEGTLHLRMAEDGGYEGELLVHASDGQSFGRQALSIRAEGDDLFAEGTLLEGQNWVADRLLLRLEGDVIEAVGRDLLPQRIGAQFRRGDCLNATS